MHACIANQTTSLRVGNVKDKVYTPINSNRNTFIAYRVMMTRLQKNKVVKYESVANQCQGSKCQGRVDQEVAVDGVAQVGDDKKQFNDEGIRELAIQACLGNLI